MITFLSAPNRTEALYHYHVPAVPGNRSAVIIPRILTPQIGGDVSLFLNVTYQNQSWTSSAPQPVVVIDSQAFANDRMPLLLISLRASFSKVTGARQNATMQIGGYYLPNLMNPSSLINIQPNSTVTGFIRGKNTVQTFRTALMDTNYTYRFTLVNTFGLMAMMVEHNNQSYNT